MGCGGGSARTGDVCRRRGDVARAARGGVVDISTRGNGAGVTGMGIKAAAATMGTAVRPAERISALGDTGVPELSGSRAMSDPLTSAGRCGDIGLDRGIDPMFGSGGGACIGS